MASKANGNRRVNTRSEEIRRRSYIEYEDGSAVRRLDDLPEESEQQERPARQQPKRRQQARSNRARVTKLSLGYVMFLTVMCVALLFSCITFLQVRSRYTRQAESIASLESTLSKLKADNDAYYKQTLDSIDLEDVKETAIDELGMHYADESQVQYYDTNEESYVRQYKDL